MLLGCKYMFEWNFKNVSLTLVIKNASVNCCYRIYAFADSVFTLCKGYCVFTVNYKKYNISNVKQQMQCDFTVGSFSLFTLFLKIVRGLC